MLTYHQLDGTQSLQKGSIWRTDGLRDQVELYVAASRCVDGTELEARRRSGE